MLTICSELSGVKISFRIVLWKYGVGVWHPCQVGKCKCLGGKKMHIWTQLPSQSYNYQTPNISRILQPLKSWKVCTLLHFEYFSWDWSALQGIQGSCNSDKGIKLFRPRGHSHEEQEMKNRERERRKRFTGRQYCRTRALPKICQQNILSMDKKYCIHLIFGIGACKILLAGLFC